MRCPAPRPGRTRRGKIFIMLAFLLPVMVGMVGLVVDGGLLLAASRQAQNAADAAATGAAMDLFRGASSSTALSTAQSLLNSNGLSNVTLVMNPSGGTPYLGGSTPNGALNNPPVDPYNTSSPYTTAAGTPGVSPSQYVEVIVSVPLTTLFIRALGVTGQQVTARAVAGYEPVAAGEGAIVLDPTATPGISVSGSGTRLIVNGTIVVNSQGSGYDQFGNTLTSTYSKPALTTSGSPTPAPIVAKDVQVVGGVDATSTIDNIRSYDPSFTGGSYPNYYYDPSNPDRPLFTRAPSVTDPLQNVPTPSSGNGAVSGTGNKNFPYYQYDSKGNSSNVATPQNVSIGNGTTVTLNPGMYQSIAITGGTVTFTPGIYIVGVNFNGGGDAFSITGGSVGVGAQTGGLRGVLIYNTGSDYTLTTPPDASDGTTLGTTSAKFGDIKVNGGSNNPSAAYPGLVPYTNVNNAADPFNGLLFYQRRWNSTSANIAGGSSLTLSGTIYAKWATFQLSGGGNYNAQFVVGSMSISGGAAVTINATGKYFGRANQVFLVE